MKKLQYMKLSLEFSKENSICHFEKKPQYVGDSQFCLQRRDRIWGVLLKSYKWTILVLLRAFYEGGEAKNLIPEYIYALNAQ